MKTFIQKFMPWIVIGGTGLLLAVPFVVTHISLYPFIFGKIIVLRIIIEIMILAFLLVIVVVGVPSLQWCHPLILALCGLFIVQIIASLFGTDFWQSFWSTQERMTGLLTLAHFLVWFFLMVLYIRTKKTWQWLLITSLIVSLVIATYAFIQPHESQLFSTLGNPIYLSVYAMIHAYFSALLLFLSKRQIGIQMFAGVACMVNLVIMLLAGGRGVVLACIASVAMIVVFCVFLLPLKMRLACIAGVLLLAAVFGGLLWYGSTPTGAQWAETSLPYSIKRIVLLKQYWNPENRTEVWKIGIEGFRERPILGWGWENFSYIYQRYYTKIIPGEGTTYFDRSHNQLIDILSLTGIIGLGAYFALWGVLYWMILRAIRHSKTLRTRSIFLLLFGLFTAYFLQNLTVFDTPAPLIMFYFSLAFAYFICNEEDLIDKYTANTTSSLRALHAVPLSFLIGAIALFAIYEFNIKPFMASAETVQAIMYVQQGNHAKSVDHFKRSLNSTAFTNYENRIQLAKYTLIAMQQGSGSAENKKNMVQFAIAEMEKNNNEHPLDVRSHYALAALYRLGSDYAIASLDAAERILTRAAELAPLRPETFTEFLQFYVQKQDVQKSKEWAEKVSQYVSKGEAHYQLGQLYLRRKEYPAMVAEMQTALSEGYNIYENTSVYPYLAKTISRKDVTPAIIAFIDAAVLAYPKNTDFFGARIVIHYKSGDKATAQKYLDEVRAQNAEFATAIEKYLEKIEK